MRTRLLRGAALGLSAMCGSAAALTIDYPITCSGTIDSDLATAITEAEGGATVRVLLSAGTCFVASTHSIDGAVTFSVIGAGTGSTIIDGNALGGAMLLVGQTTEGVDLSLRSLTIQNAAHAAIGIVKSTLHVDQVRFLGIAGSFGSAISATLATASISRSSFENCSATTGGAIQMEGGGTVSLSIADSAFLNNTSGSNGGAIGASIPVLLDRVLFSGNHADSGYGGAVYVFDQDLTIRNSTFTGNGAASGGALVAEGFQNPFAVVALNNVTLHGDSASTSGTEILIAGSPPDSILINNSLVGGTCAGFPFAPVAHGSVESPGDTCGFSNVTNQVSVADANLMLGTLADNGGSTKTLLPGTGSVLIDAGSNDCERVDQRDLVRNVGACDVGAVEVGATLADSIFADGFDG